MAIKYAIDKHAICFQSKIASAISGHILNMHLQGDLDNGTVRGVGDYVSFDGYKDAAADAGFKAKIVDKAANGNWYVQVTEINVNKPSVLIDEVVVIPENYTREFSDPANFYNKAGDVVRGYVLQPLDIFELSDEGFTGNAPAVGKALTANAAGKLVVA